MTGDLRHITFVPPGKKGSFLDIVEPLCQTEESNVSFAWSYDLVSCEDCLTKFKSQSDRSRR